MRCRFSKYACVYFSLFFGGGAHLLIGGIISTLLMHVVASHRPMDGHAKGPESYVAFQYVDDGAFVGPRLGLFPWGPFTLWEYAIAMRLGPAALNIRKREIEGLSDTNIAL